MIKTKTSKVGGIPSLFLFSAKTVCFLHFLWASLFVVGCAQAQTASIDPRWVNGFWKAKWIGCPGASGTQFGVYHFRRALQLDTVPKQFIIHVSADNRYRLFVNGESIGAGPARSDLANWNFETYDIAPYLQKGSNSIAATVWNFAAFRPYAQFSFHTAFIVQGNSEIEASVNTNADWKVIQDNGYAPLPINRAEVQAYMVVAQGEQLHAEGYPWGFQSTQYDDRHWPQAEVLWYPAKSKTFGTDGNWQLVPRSIPIEEETIQYFSRCIGSDDQQLNTRLAIDGQVNLVIPPRSKKHILIDQAFLTNAYPHLVVSSGKDASITITYAEALFDAKGNKGHRDSTAGKVIKGLRDQFIADGGSNRDFSPLHFRTFRYISLAIETADEALTLLQVFSVFTGYPFKESASFVSDQPWIGAVWKTGWRTARLCAVDTYMDCPYYEQLQYVGDTRIQSLISLYVSGDDRLMKKAIDDIGHSFLPEGLTQSRYPCYDLQVIPPFSLWWIHMIHDYWMHRKDDAFVKSHLNGIQSVLRWYRQKMGSDSLLGPLQWWQFTDWSWPWVDSISVGGVPPGATRGGAVILSLQYAYALQKASDIMYAYGEKEWGRAYAREANAINQAVFRTCWNPQRQLLADTKEMYSYSQHANILGVLTGAIPASQHPYIIDKIIDDSTLTKATYYFTFYLFEAMKSTGHGERFIELLQPWQKMIQQGLTTFAEQDDPTRSDCHAWSASPNFALLSLVCGIRPLSPGFDDILFQPQPGALTHLTGHMPHPRGMIEIDMVKIAGRYNVELTLPEGTKGVFKWKKHQYSLAAGKQRLTVE